MWFLLFALVVLALLGLANRFVHRRAREVFGLSRKASWAIAAIQIAGILAILVGRLFARVFASDASAAVSGMGWGVQLAVVLTAAMLTIERTAVWLIRIVGRAASKSALAAKTKPSDLTAAPATTPLTRRDWLVRAATGSALAVGGGTSGWSWLFGRHDYVIEEVPVRLAKLPRTLDGFTIAQLSDLHLGLFVGEREMNSAIELVRRARPNLVAITGDMIDSQRDFAPALGRLVRALGAIAPVVVVPGNHDYYAGIDEALANVTRAGGQVLLNRNLLVGEGRIAIAGVDDLWARRYGRHRGPNLAAAMAGIRDDASVVLLAHHPQYFAETFDRVDLQISGHTHGGQFNPIVRPAELLLPHGWVEGRYRRASGQLYVNRGFGTAGPPARLGAAPEVTRVVLTV
jgi:predicted MPP superfamily phosphohydrolase